MKINKKRLMLILLVLGSIFILSGCAAPTDEAGKIIKITTSTTFNDIFKSESWFSAIFVYPLAQAINIIAPKTGATLAIIIVSVVVNAVVLAFTLKSNIQTQNMQLIQPELTKIQKKYEGKTDDASKMRQANEMSALYKKYDINPFGAMLVNFIQLPIILAMYQAVQRSQAVTDGTIFGLSLEQSPLNGVTSGQFLYIPIFAVMIVAQLGSMLLPQYIAKQKAIEEAKLHHRKPNIPENPAQKMMYYTMVPILVFAAILPSAMTVYWIVNSLINIAKTLLIQNIISKNKLEVK